MVSAKSASINQNDLRPIIKGMLAAAETVFKIENTPKADENLNKSYDTKISETIKNCSSEIVSFLQDRVNGSEQLEARVSSFFSRINSNTFKRFHSQIKQIAYAVIDELKMRDSIKQLIEKRNPYAIRFAVLYPSEDFTITQETKDEVQKFHRFIWNSNSEFDQFNWDLTTVAIFVRYASPDEWNGICDKVLKEKDEANIQIFRDFFMKLPPTDNEWEEKKKILVGKIDKKKKNCGTSVHTKDLMQKNDSESKTLGETVQGEVTIDNNDSNLTMTDFAKWSTDELINHIEKTEAKLLPFLGRELLTDSRWTTVKPVLLGENHAELADFFVQQCPKECLQILLRLIQVDSNGNNGHDKVIDHIINAVSPEILEQEMKTIWNQLNSKQRYGMLEKGKPRGQAAAIFSTRIQAQSVEDKDCLEFDQAMSFLPKESYVEVRDYLVTVCKQHLKRLCGEIESEEINGEFLACFELMQRRKIMGITFKDIEWMQTLPSGYLEILIRATIRCMNNDFNLGRVIVQTVLFQVCAEQAEKVLDTWLKTLANPRWYEPQHDFNKSNYKNSIELVAECLGNRNSQLIGYFALDLAKYGAVLWQELTAEKKSRDESEHEWIKNFCLAIKNSLAELEGSIIDLKLDSPDSAGPIMKWMCELRSDLEGVGIGASIEPDEWGCEIRYDPKKHKLQGPNNVEPNAPVYPKMMGLCLKQAIPDSWDDKIVVKSIVGNGGQ